MTAREILDRLKPMGISRALVHSALSKELHPVEGNAAVLEEVKDTPLVPCWSALPAATHELAPPDQFIKQMRANGVGALRLFPLTHSYVLSDWCMGTLYEALEADRVPIFVEVAQTSMDQVASALHAFPKLRMILVRPAYRGDRMIYPLMERYEHLYIETSNYVASGGIEEVCRRFGSRRLVFGTGLPYYEPGAAVSSVTYAEIDDDDKQAIAGGNLEELLGWAGEDRGRRG